MTPERKPPLPAMFSRWRLIAVLAGTLLALVGCATLDEKQGEWIFQPTDSSWGGQGFAADMDDVWIEFDSALAARRVRLHALWMPARHQSESAPVLLYLHGSRFNLNGSAHRVRRMQALGFSVLALDYRGFGKSDAATPSEALANEDARAAWDWIGQRYPQRSRYVFGHSLGGAIAIELASRVDDEAGTMVEGTFTSLPELVDTTRFGWLPIGGLITQRFEAVKRVAELGSPLLVVHGSRDSLVKPELGRRLFDAARDPKAFVLVDGGSHYNTNALGHDQYRAAISQLFGLK
jgi:alpha-beta hydrolase superfamily lysophospholipase